MTEFRREKKKLTWAVSLGVSKLAVRMIKTLKVDSDFAVVGSQAELPLVTIKDAVLFPHNVIPVGNLVGFTATMLKQADRGNFRVGVVTVSESADDWDEVYSIGTEGPIVQIMKLPDGTTPGGYDNITTFFDPVTKIFKVRGSSVEDNYNSILSLLSIGSPGSSKEKKHSDILSAIV